MLPYDLVGGPTDDEECREAEVLSATIRTGDSKGSSDEKDIVVISFSVMTNGLKKGIDEGTRLQDIRDLMLKERCRRVLPRFNDAMILVRPVNYDKAMKTIAGHDRDWSPLTLVTEWDLCDKLEKRHWRSMCHRQNCNSP